MKWDLVSDYLLAATNPPNGKFRDFGEYAFGGAVLGELLACGDVELAGKKVRAVREASDDIYRDVVDAIRASRPRSVGYWVGRLNGRHFRHVRWAVMRRLENAGILREEPTWFGFRYPVVDAEAAAARRRRLHDAVAGGPLDARVRLTVALLAATYGLGCRTDPRHVRRELRRAGRRWGKGDPIVRAVDWQVAGIMTAIMTPIWVVVVL